MGQEVKLQGQQLNAILEDVEIAKSNVQLADSIISDAEKRSRWQMKKVIWIVLIIFVIVAIIIAIIIVIFLGK